MATIAIIGVDGSGKTSVCHTLLETFPLPIKYLYMGPGIESSNFSLPSSKLILALKLRSYRKTAERLGINDPKYLTTHHMEHRRDNRGSLGAVLRLINRTAESWYRQVISWVYQLRGYVVLYDRHFIFDATPSGGMENISKMRITDRINYWLLDRFFPRPDLAIILDAPPNVLYERKKEGNLEYLARRRQAFLDQGRLNENFICVDATQPLDKVLVDVERHMMLFLSKEETGKVQV
jgi:thymidylate kinase